VQRLLDVVCLSDRIHRLTDGVTHRAILSDEEIGCGVDGEELPKYCVNDDVPVDDREAVRSHHGFTEPHCGRCPAFRFCGDPGIAAALPLAVSS